MVDIKLQKYWKIEHIWFLENSILEYSPNDFHIWAGQSNRKFHERKTRTKLLPYLELTVPMKIKLNSSKYLWRISGIEW